jgi:hypothetical protein
MKQAIDALVKDDKQIQKLLTWANYKANSINTTEIKSSQVRFFYLYFAPNFDEHFDFYLYENLDLNVDFYLDLYLYENLNLDLKIDLYLYKIEKLDSSPQSSDFLNELDSLMAQLPKPETGEENIQEWLKNNGQQWQQDYRNLLMKYRNIGHRWDFDKQQKELTEQYFRANQLLEECLQRECVVSPEMRKEIEEGLYLP